MKLIKKEWGHEEILYNKEYCVKRLVMKKGYQSSVHVHGKKTESFIMERGKILFLLGRKHDALEPKHAKPGEFIHVPVGMWHRFIALSDNASFIECSTHDDPKFTIRDPDNLSGKVK